MTDLTVNIPLLRKAVEWAEAEAAKPRELCEWEQGYFMLEAVEPGDQRIRSRMGKSLDCGTCYCIAGFVAAQVGWNYGDEGDIEVVAGEALGIDGHDWMSAEGDHLFAASNSIADVRRIAESLAGERL